MANSSKIACRCPEKLTESTINKIVDHCQVEPHQVLAVHDVASTYHVPMLLDEQGLISTLKDGLRLDAIPISPALASQGRASWKQWKALATAQDRVFETVSIALVGKYTNLHDSYLSVIKSLEHAAMHCRRKLKLIWVNAQHLEQPTSSSDPASFHKAWHEVCTADGILVPGGFGYRGTEGMIAAAKWAREHKTPYLGVCLGMQLAVVEFARSVVGLQDALSGEFATEKPTENEVIVFMPEVDKTKLGGTMRLGLRPTVFQESAPWSKLRALYAASSAPSAFAVNVPASPTVTTSAPSVSFPDNKGTPAPPVAQAGTLTYIGPAASEPAVFERHRHRYEVNPAYIERLQKAGLAFVGKDESGERMEIVELDQEAGHPFYVGVQFHPEYLGRVLRPSIPYLGLVAASCGMLERFLHPRAAGQSMVDEDL